MSLTTLAKTILENASTLEGYFRSNGLQMPTFDEHALSDLPLSSEMEKVRSAALDAATEMRDLLTGPAMLLRPVLNATSLQTIYKYDLASKVPLDGQTSYAELAQASGLQEHDVRRTIRFAIFHHRVFQERSPGIVSHSGASRLLATSPDAMAGLGFMFDECYQSFAHTVKAFQTNPNPEPNQTGWALSVGSHVPMWDYHIEHPQLGERAARAMNAFTKGMTHDVSSLTSGYDWTNVDAHSGSVVDLGGADGNASIAIARKYPRLHFTVQELPWVVEAAKDKLPADVKSRVDIVAHNFFEPQPVSADVYLIRQILHNWSDAHCIKILEALVPALKPGNKILINDLVVPPPNVLPQFQERHIRAMDMIMLSLFNSRERERADWISLFNRADSRFSNIKIWKPDNSPLGLIESTWSG